MAKVYVVTSGEYSDYSIEAMFSKKKLAEAFCKEYNKVSRVYGYAWDEADIEEHELDVSPKKYLQMRVWMAKDGEATVEQRVGINPPSGFVCFTYDNEPKLLWEVATTNEKRAIKVVNEKRIQILALNNWYDTEAVRGMK